MVELPCGYLWTKKDGTNVRLRKFRLREMTGEEQDILAIRPKDGKIPTEEMYRRIALVLSRLIVGCDDDVGEEPPQTFSVNAILNLPMEDFSYLVLGATRISHGDVLDFTITCPKCKNDGRYSFDISELEVIPLKADEDPAWCVSTPQAPQLARLRLPVVRDAIWEVTANSFFPDHHASISLAHNLAELQGTPVVRGEKKEEIGEILKRIRALSVRQIAAIRKAAKGVGGEFDASGKYTCASCGENGEIPLVGNVLTFFMTGVSVVKTP
jgi:hypothetical protein